MSTHPKLVVAIAAAMCGVAQAATYRMVIRAFRASSVTRRRNRLRTAGVCSGRSSMATTTLGKSCRHTTAIAIEVG